MSLFDVVRGDFMIKKKIGYTFIYFKLNISSKNFKVICLTQVYSKLEEEFICLKRKKSEN